MKMLKCLLTAGLLLSGAAMAAPASEQSIRELLEVSNIHHLVDSMQGEMQQMMTRLTPQLQKISQDFEAEIKAAGP